MHPESLSHSARINQKLPEMFFYYAYSASFDNNFLQPARRFLIFYKIFYAVAESFYAIAETFYGIAETFYGIAENFYDAAEKFYAIVETFRDADENFYGIAQSFGGIAECFVSRAEMFVGIAKSFVSRAETFGGRKNSRAGNNKLPSLEKEGWRASRRGGWTRLQIPNSRFQIKPSASGLNLEFAFWNLES